MQRISAVCLALPCALMVAHDGLADNADTATFDLNNDTHYIPLCLGVGKAWKSGDNILNAVVEPQWTVQKKVDGLPRLTVFAGLNLTFGK